MRLQDALYFSPKFKYEVLDLEDVGQLVCAFEDRVKGFYFNPAEKLADDFDSFASGALTMAAIDFIGYLLYGTANSHRIKHFCRGLKSIRHRQEHEVNDIVKRINEDYRNGLIHEGRIKRLGQFAIDIDELIVIRDNFSVINPRLLLAETRELFQTKIEELQNSKLQLSVFRKQFTNIFQYEL